MMSWEREKREGGYLANSAEVQEIGIEPIDQRSPRHTVVEAGTTNGMRKEGVSHIRSDGWSGKRGMGGSYLSLKLATGTS
jgi:hypothetical protein